MRGPDFAPHRAADIYVRFWRGESTDKLMVEFRCSDQTIRNIADKKGPYAGPDYEVARKQVRRGMPKISEIKVEGGRNMSKIGEFQECPTCAAKPGSPTMCSSCLNNRQAQRRQADRIEALEAQLADAHRHMREAGLPLPRTTKEESDE